MAEQILELTPQELEQAQGLNLTQEELNAQMQLFMKRFPMVPLSEFRKVITGILQDTAAAELQSRVVQPTDPQVYQDTISLFLRQLTLLWAAYKPSLDIDKAAPVLAQALQNRGRARPGESIRDAAKFVYARIQRGELDKFL
ncbi:MAG: hypothetical protein J0I20_34050 [Chloroflexi bacterium]|nr:hypothetical protein [Chloroflexota bacterium]